MEREIEFEGANLYNLNKKLVEENCSPLGGTALRNAIRSIRIFTVDKREKYYMLLCRERNDYTIFARVEDSANEFKEALYDCLTNRGTIYSIESVNENTAFEIWIKADDDKEMYCYLFFPYDMGVLEV